MLEFEHADVAATRAAPPRYASRTDRRVAAIIERVRTGRDRALRRYATELDGLTGPIEIPRGGMGRGRGDSLPRAVRTALKRAARHIRRVARAQVPRGRSALTVTPGSVVEQRVIPLDRVGCYVPGGLLSAALVTADDGDARPRRRRDGGDRRVAASAPGGARRGARGRRRSLLPDRRGARDRGTRLRHPHRAARRQDRRTGQPLGVGGQGARQRRLRHRFLRRPDRDPDRRVEWPGRLGCRRSHRPGRARSRRARRCSSRPAATPGDGKSPLHVERLRSTPRDRRARRSHSHGGIIVTRHLAEAMRLANDAAPEHLVVETEAMARAGALRRRRLRRPVDGAGRRRLRHRIESRAADGGRRAFSRRLECRGLRPPGVVQRVTPARAARALAPTITTLARAEGLEAAHARALQSTDDRLRPRLTADHMTRIQGIPDLGPGLRLHLNENTGGCSPKVVDAVRAFDARGLATYPDYRRGGARDGGVSRRRSRLAGADQRSGRGCAADRNRRISRTAEAPDGARRRCVMAMPAFETYVTTAQAMGARIVTVPPGPDYAFPLDARRWRRSRRETRLIYINNPNNPTGQPVPKDAIRRIATRGARTPSCSSTRRITTSWARTFSTKPRRIPNVLIGRTFSKAHGLAGMRVGVMIAPPAMLEPIRFVMPLFNLNVVAVQALRAALTDREFTPWYVAQATESKRCSTTSSIASGFRYWKSAANFVLVDGGDRAPRARRRADRARRARSRSHAGSVLPQLLPHHRRRRRAHRRRRSTRWRRCAQSGNRAEDGGNARSASA